MRGTDVLVLPPDVAVMAVNAFDAEIRRRLSAEDGDCVVSRRAYRARPLLVRRDEAAFLAQFRQPRTVIAAVLHHCEEYGGSPEEVLSDVIPVVVRTRALSLLVESGTAAARELGPGLRPGARVAGLRVESCVQLLDDVGVYRAVNRSGSACALKLLQPTADHAAVQAIEREAAVLEQLAGRGAPRLLRSTSWRGRRCLVTSWCPGRSLEAAAETLRESYGPLSEPVLQLCAAVLDAYARLHELGVVHGDVQPRNIVVGEEGSITLLDFAASRRAGADGRKHQQGRMGLIEYIEPECADRLVRQDPLPAPTEAGEQYALGALCYALAAGVPYLDLAMVQDDWVRKVCDLEPRSFRELGIAGGAAIEAVLRTALGKRPEERHESVAAFARAFRRAARRARARPGLSARARRFLSGAVDRYAIHDGCIAAHLCEPPRASLSYGAGGLAYFCYRLTLLRGDPAPLAAAAAWSRWASTHGAGAAGCDCPELGIDSARVGAVSLHHRPLGIALVGALVAHAAGDRAACNRATADFLANAGRPCADADLTTGQAGALLGCAALTETLPGRDGFDRGKVAAHAGRLAARLGGALDRSASRPSSGFRFLGTAHGSAGVLYAALRWHEATGAVIRPLRVRLQELADACTWSGSVASWPIGLGSAQVDGSAHTSWCNGSAGYVELWALADRLFPGDGFAALAIGAAEHLWSAYRADAPANGSLCCGYAGQGFAMLTLFRRDGDPRWLSRAHAMLDRAIERAGAAERRHSLYKGDAGIALLAEELTRPSLSRMPLFEAEGWPRRA